MATNKFNLSNLSKVKLVHNPSFKRHGTAQYARALNKYYITPTINTPFEWIAPTDKNQQQGVMGKIKSKVRGKKHVEGHILVRKDASSQTGTEPATGEEGDSLYLAPVNIGTPAQTMNLDFDTGSSDLWVLSTELPQSVQTTKTSDGSTHAIFDPSKSSTWEPMSGSTWKISYGDGSSASGNVGTDQVTLGGLTINNQAVELASQASQSFYSGPGDGLLGLAWGNINTVQPKAVQTPVENMITQQDIPQSSELFTALLSEDPNKSFYTFGFIDQETANGATPLYTPVDNSQGFWQFPSTTAVVGGQTVQRANNTAIADTGTTLCLVSDSLCEAFYGALGSNAKQDSSQGGWVFKTSAASQLPSLQLAVGDNLFTVNPSDLSFQQVDDTWTFGGLQSVGDLGMDIFGDVFLRSVYAIFDQGNTRFGAIQRDGTGAVSSAGSSGTATSGSTAAEAKPKHHHHHH